MAVEARKKIAANNWKVELPTICAKGVGSARTASRRAASRRNHQTSGAALATGLALVSAMAIQNAAQRIHLGVSPPTTLMTGDTTQIMIDVADLMHGMAIEKQGALRARLPKMMAAVMAFALGCAGAAIVYARVGVYCFLIPPLLGVGTLMFRMTAYEGDVR